MLRRLRVVIVALTGALVLFLAGRQIGLAQQSQQQPQENLLVIGSFNVAPGRSLNDATAEMTQLVRDLRATNEFRSVRLYMHSWGPELAFYLVQEPRSWQAIKNAYDKLFAARPDLLTSPMNWSGHADNILSEIPVP